MEMYFSSSYLNTTPRTISRYYLAIVDDHWSKLFSSLSIVKGSPSFANLDQQGLPLCEVFTKTVVNVFSLHVPQALVLQPNLNSSNKNKAYKQSNNHVYPVCPKSHKS